MSVLKSGREYIKYIYIYIYINGIEYRIGDLCGFFENLVN